MPHFFFKQIKKNACRYHYQNLDDMIYSSWDMEQNIPKLVILGHFLPLYPLKTTKIKILKNQKFAGDIIILSMCTKNHNHIMYGSWDTEWDRQFFCNFWSFFCLFNNPPCPPSPQPNDPKNQNLEKKKSPEILSFYTYICTINEDYMTILLPFLSHDNPENENFKIQKNTWRYYHFTHLHCKWQ